MSQFACARPATGWHLNSCFDETECSGSGSSSRQWRPDVRRPEVINYHGAVSSNYQESLILVRTTRPPSSWLSSSRAPRRCTDIPV